MNSKIAIAAALCLFGCLPNQREDLNTKESIVTNECENFDSFYLRFHSDTLFQTQRINFPLKGYDINEENSIGMDTSEFFWDRKNWEYHILFKVLAPYARQRKQVKDTLIEKIFIPNSGFFTERKFVCKERKWYLEFYGNQEL